jgi:methyl-accepting chemotaxis protein
VNTAVNQMDQVTQQNAAMVEESTAASHSLAGEAAALSELVSKFNIGEAGAPAAKPAPKPAVTQQQARAAAFAAEKEAQPARKSAAAVALKPQSNLAEDDWEEF